MTTVFTILFDGVAYGMLLFVLACGLAVTLGLMNFVNLAHGAFARHFLVLPESFTASKVANSTL